MKKVITVEQRESDGRFEIYHNVESDGGNLRMRSYSNWKTVNGAMKAAESQALLSPDFVVSKDVVYAKEVGKKKLTKKEMVEKILADNGCDVSIANSIMEVFGYGTV